MGLFILMCHLVWLQGSTESYNIRLDLIRFISTKVFFTFYEILLITSIFAFFLASDVTSNECFAGNG